MLMDNECPAWETMHIKVTAITFLSCPWQDAFWNHVCIYSRYYTCIKNWLLDRWNEIIINNALKKSIRKVTGLNSDWRAWPGCWTRKQKIREINNSKNSVRNLSLRASLSILLESKRWFCRFCTKVWHGLAYLIGSSALTWPQKPQRN